MGARSGGGGGGFREQHTLVKTAAEDISTEVQLAAESGAGDTAWQCREVDDELSIGSGL